jgi:hypothetical protein
LGELHSSVASGKLASRTTLVAWLLAGTDGSAQVSETLQTNHVPQSVKLSWRTFPLVGPSVTFSTLARRIRFMLTARPFLNGGCGRRHYLLSTRVTTCVPRRCAPASFQPCMSEANRQATIKLRTARTQNFLAPAARHVRNFLTRIFGMLVMPYAVRLCEVRCGL